MALFLTTEDKEYMEGLLEPTLNYELNELNTILEVAQRYVRTLLPLFLPSPFPPSPSPSSRLLILFIVILNRVEQEEPEVFKGLANETALKWALVAVWSRMWQIEEVGGR